MGTEFKEYKTKVAERRMERVINELSKDMPDEQFMDFVKENEPNEDIKAVAKKGRGSDVVQAEIKRNKLRAEGWNV